MTHPRDVWRGLRLRWDALFNRRAMERRLRQEVRFHLEMEKRKAIAEGYDPERARLEARRRFGPIESYKEQSRDERGGRTLEMLLQDLRYGLRTLWHNPGFTAVAVITLGLGIGANTAIFSVVNGVLLRGLDFEEPDRIVRLFHSAVDGTYSRSSTTPANYYAWKSGSRSLASAASSTCSACRHFSGALSPRPTTLPMASDSWC